MSWISFTYTEEYLSSVILWLFLLLFLIYSIWLYFYFICCVVSFLFCAYKKMNNHQENDFYYKFWDKPRCAFSHFLLLVGRIWHGHEIIGMEHVPEGPGIFIYHHSIIPAGYSLLVGELYTKKGRLCHSVIDHGLIGIPGMKNFYDMILMKDFKKTECVEILKKGHFLGIAPGGAREANFGADYNLMWGNRTGFAQVALEAKVPIIPVFTQNNCEAYRTFGRTRLTKWLYEKTRKVLLPIYGGFPVKLRTYIGEPIPYDSNLTATELAEKTKVAVENLRDRHQKQPGNILRALLERFDKQSKNN